MPTEIILQNPLHALILSASLGALIGGVRQWMDQQVNPETPGQPNHPGIRTFTLWGVLGYLSVFFSKQFGVPYFFTASFVVFALFMGGAYMVTGGNRAAFGLTTHTAGVLTFLSGALVGYESTVMALVITGLCMIIVGARQRVHGWTRQLTQKDLSSTLQFVAITGVILPLVPNKWYALKLSFPSLEGWTTPAPYDVFNPYETWLMVVLIAGLGFVGYLAMRFLGTRVGIIITGVVGGIASSTATTLAMSRESRERPGIGVALALAVVLSCVVMCVRVLVMILVIDRSVFVSCLLPFALISLPGIVFLLWVVLHKRRKNAHVMDSPDFNNPLSLSMALKFGAIYAVVAAAVKILSQLHMEGGVYTVAFFSGLLDMAAISISSAQAVAVDAMSVQTATKAVIVGAIANTIVKGALALSLGAGVFKKSVAIALGATLLAALAALVFV